MIHPTVAEPQLARFKCPRSVDFLDSLPRLPTGKLYERLFVLSTSRPKTRPPQTAALLMNPTTRWPNEHALN